LLEAARAYEGLTAVFYFANETQRTLYAAFRSLNLAEAAGPSPELARGYTSVGAIIGFMPLHNVAETYFRRAWEASKDVEDLSARMWVSLGTGMYYAGVGQWVKSQDLLRQVVETAEVVGDRSRWADGIGNLAVLRYFQGQFHESMRLSQDFYAAAVRRNDAHNRAWALRSQVFCLLPCGKYGQALACLEEIQALLADDRHIVDEALRIDLYGLLGLVLLRLDKPNQALAAARKAMKVIKPTRPTSYLSLPGYASVAETYLSLRESEIDPPPAKLQDEAEQALKALASYGRVFPIGRPRLYLWQGLFRWQMGQPESAKKLWGKSLLVSEQLGMSYDQALTHLECGRRLPPTDPAQVTHATRASEIFEKLGIPCQQEK
jgi:tetratricopeptide (TPR) repeat protein